MRENLPRICLLLVDADEVNRASLLEELEYKDLFKTVLDRVGKLPCGEFLGVLLRILVGGVLNASARFFESWPFALFGPLVLKCLHTQ